MSDNALFVVNILLFVMYHMDFALPQSIKRMGKDAFLFCFHYVVLSKERGIINVVDGQSISLNFNLQI